MARIIVVRPSSDWVLREIVYKWAEEAVKALHACGMHEIEDLCAGRANRDEVEAEIEKGCSALFFYGHSPCLTEGFVDGQHLSSHHVPGVIESQQPIIDEHNCHLLKGKIVYAWSCCTLKYIGDKAIKGGASAFIGFNSPLLLDPDSAFEWIMRAANAAPLYLAGVEDPNATDRSCDAAVSYARDVCTQGIKYYTEREGRSSPEWGLAARRLTQIRGSIDVLGDRNASLF